jgi:2-iminobutanoate/2-iminopropanoate deaminase
MKNGKGDNLARRTLLKGSIAVGGAAAVAVAAPNKPASKKKVLTSSRAALPIGPYSQGIQVGNLVFVAGEKGIDPKTGKIAPGGIVAETRQTLENIKAILAEAGATLDDAVSSTVHMTDLKEFQQMNQVYAEYFRKDPPGRTTVQVPALPAGARIEITVIAAV